MGGTPMLRGAREDPFTACFYDFSSTFQYASVTNFSQLALYGMRARTMRGVHSGLLGFLCSFSPASAGVRLAFLELHFTQATTQLSHADTPPRERGVTWSIVSSSPPGRP